MPQQTPPRRDRRKGQSGGDDGGAADDRRIGERRAADRVPIEMWVEETSDRELYFQRSANLSTGGIFLEHTVPHPIGKVVNLQFTLPGDSERIQARGEIVSAPAGKELGMGIRFVDLDPDVR